MSDSANLMERVGRLPWRALGWSLAILLLLLPLVAMQFTREVAWTASDFLLAAMLLGGTGLLIELAVSRSRDIVYRLAAIGALLTALLMLWMNLAVGIIGPQSHGANAWIPGVHLVGFLGAWVSRLKPAGMAATLVAMALAQCAIVFATILTCTGVPAPSLGVLLALNGVFIAAWLVCAGLFLWSARRYTVGRCRN